MFFREEYIGEFRFVEYSPYRLRHPGYAIIALPDAGLVGVIGASHMIKVLGMEEVGGADSPLFPPVTIVSKGEIRLPIRLFVKDNILLIYSEIALPPQAIYGFARALMDYVERKGSEQLILMTGLAVPHRFELENLRTYYIPTTKEADEIVKASGAQRFENGFLVGPYALLLKEAVRARISTVMIATESFLEFPDPEASAKNLQVIGKVVGTEIDVKELLERAEVIRLRARDAMRSVMRNMEQMRKEYEYTPPLHI